MPRGCPEYILLFRKLPTDRSTAYADVPVSKSKDEYTRAQWQIDAHGYWRSSGDRLISKEELKDFPVDKLQQAYRKYSRENIYNYDDLQVHHIIPIDKNYDLKLDENNLITLCSYHHKQAEQNKITKEYLYKLIDITPESNN